MRILIIVCRQTHLGTYHLPLGIGYVSASLKHAGHDVVLLNPNHSRESLDDLVSEELDRRQPNIVALGGMAFHLAEIKHAAALARQKLPAAKIVVGGPLVSNQPQVVMNAVPEADYGVIGEGEHTSVELAAALAIGQEPFNVNGLIYREPGNPDVLKLTEPRLIEENLDTLPWVDYEGLGLDVYAGLHRPGECAPGLVVDKNTRVMPILTSRGCPYSCTFCCHEAAGRRYRLRSLDDVFAEVQAAVVRYGINAVFVYDDLFCLQRSRLEDFCRRIAKLGLRWECSMTAGQLNPDVLKLMKDSGCCCISVGVESMSPTVLKSMQKRTTKQQLELLLPQIYDAKIGIWSNLIFGDPAETLETVTESLEWFSNHPQYNFRFANIGYHPGSRIYDDALARGLIADPVAYLLSGNSEINATSMSDEAFLASRLLTSRAIVSFGFAGKLLDLNSSDPKVVTATCACPYCGAQGRNYTLTGTPGMLASISCPDCNRAYRVPLVVRLCPPPEALVAVASAGRLEASGVLVRELEAASQKILLLDPTNTYAWNLLIRLADFCSNPVAAARLLEHLIVADPYNPTLFEQMAARLTLLGADGPREKYLGKSRHLRSIGVTATTYLDVVVSSDERKGILARQIGFLNRSLPIASFLPQHHPEALRAAS